MMMTITLNLEDKESINEVNRYCLVKGIDVKCQYSKMTNNVIYAFKDDYPKNISGAKYVEV